MAKRQEQRSLDSIPVHLSGFLYFTWKTRAERSKRLKTLARQELEWGEAKESRGPSPHDAYVLTSLFSPLASPLSPQHKLPPSTPSLTGALALTRSCLVSLLNPPSWGLNTEGWCRKKSKVPVISVLTCAEKICQWNKNGSYKGKRRQREILGEEAEHRTFHTSLLDCTQHLLHCSGHSTERGNGWEKVAVQVWGAQEFCFLMTQRPCLSHPSLLLTPTAKYRLGMTETSAYPRSRELKGPCLRGRLRGRGQRGGRIPPGKPLRPGVGHSSSRSNQIPGSP